MAKVAPLAKVRETAKAVPLAKEHVMAKVVRLVKEHAMEKLAHVRALAMATEFHVKAGATLWQWMIASSIS